MNLKVGVAVPKLLFPNEFADKMEKSKLQDSMKSFFFTYDVAYKAV